MAVKNLLKMPIVSFNHKKYIDIIEKNKIESKMSHHIFKSYLLEKIKNIKKKPLHKISLTKDDILTIFISNVAEEELP